MRHRTIRIRLRPIRVQTNRLRKIFHRIPELAKSVAGVSSIHIRVRIRSIDPYCYVVIRYRFEMLAIKGECIGSVVVELR